ncbi:MAG: hypothetical protein V4496_04535 [Pseudomonadota bacterium]
MTKYLDEDAAPAIPDSVMRAEAFAKMRLIELLRQGQEPLPIFDRIATIIALTAILSSAVKLRAILSSAVKLVADEQGGEKTYHRLLNHHQLLHGGLSAQKIGNSGMYAQRSKAAQEQALHDKKLGLVVIPAKK